jgi:hypothetical protein
VTTLTGRNPSIASRADPGLAPFVPMIAWLQRNFPRRSPVAPMERRAATAYVIYKDRQVTLAVLFVRPEDRLPELVAALLRRLRILGLKIRRLYLDRGFCSIPVLRYLMLISYSHPTQGKTPPHRIPIWLGYRAGSACRA